MFIAITIQRAFYLEKKYAIVFTKLNYLNKYLDNQLCHCFVSHIDNV